MRDDFCIFVLTHGRADHVLTIETLRKCRYTGKIYVVIDDEDRQRDAYLERYGDAVLVFSKAEIAEHFDEGDNFDDRRSVFYARNACWELARKVGVRYFMQCDDDYDSFSIRLSTAYNAKYLDEIIDLMVEYFASIPALSIAMSQGGDHIGISKGVDNFPLRKAMNTFLCDVERPFKFRGKINDDVTAYTSLGREGALFLTIPNIQVNQKATQTNPGGMTEFFKDSGTYLKSFYSVMYTPSAVKIGELAYFGKNSRIHHAINWRATAAQIIPESYRKPTGRQKAKGEKIAPPALAVAAQ